MKNIKKLFIAAIIVCLIAIVVIWTTNSNVKSKTEAAIYNNITNVPKTKVAIIFGAGINGDKPSRYLKDRLDAGIELYKNNKVDKILLSGDKGRD